MVYLIDTNIFLRTLIKEEQSTFDQCYQLLQAVKTNQLTAVTAHLILAEIVWTLKSYYQLPKAQILRATRGIINLRGLKLVDHYQADMALKFYQDHSVKFIDTLIASIPEVSTKQWTVVSYDQDFDKLKMLRQEPNQVLASLEN